MGESFIEGEYTVREPNEVGPAPEAVIEIKDADDTLGVVLPEGSEIAQDIEGQKAEWKKHHPEGHWSDDLK